MLSKSQLPNVVIHVFTSRLTALGAGTLDDYYIALTAFSLLKNGLHSPAAQCLSGSFLQGLLNQSNLSDDYDSWLLHFSLPIKNLVSDRKVLTLWNVRYCSS